MVVSTSRRERVPSSAWRMNARKTSSPSLGYHFAVVAGCGVPNCRPSNLMTYRSDKDIGPSWIWLRGAIPVLTARPHGPCSISRCRTVLMFAAGTTRSLEEVPVYAQLPYSGFECLSGNTQLNGGAGWSPNHAFGFPESGLEYFSFVLYEIGDQPSSRRSHLGIPTREPGLIYKKSPLQTKSPPVQLHFATRGCCLANRTPGRVPSSSCLCFESSCPIFGRSGRSISDQQGNITNALPQCR
jgi:hypothetical protein